MILHTQSFTKKENESLVLQLNLKFKFHSKIISHKTNYFVIKIPKSD